MTRSLSCCGSVSGLRIRTMDLAFDSAFINMRNQLRLSFVPNLVLSGGLDMDFRTLALRPLAFALLGTSLSAGAGPVPAQDSGKGFELHTNSSATAADVGLPVYPRAKLSKSAGNDSAVDMGFTFGDTHFRLVAANYVSGDSIAQILDFYRKPLARYGDVLECDHGKPVGATKTARSGLTCGDHNGNENSSENHELRAGTPEKFRIVGIAEREGSAIHFGLVYVETPKETGSRP
jgi:hypothetical protein